MSLRCFLLLCPLAPRKFVFTALHFLIVRRRSVVLPQHELIPLDSMIHSYVTQSQLPPVPESFRLLGI